MPQPRLDPACATSEENSNKRLKPRKWEAGMGRLEGRTAVVTGAASGIGRATSKLFAKEGASVVCVDRVAEVEATAEAIRQAGGKAVAMTGDAGKEDDVKAYIDKAISEFHS